MGLLLSIKPTQLWDNQFDWTLDISKVSHHLEDTIVIEIIVGFWLHLFSIDVVGYTVYGGVANLLVLERRGKIQVA